MKERPILFSGEMVRAILDGRKTQTRRAAKGMALEWLDGAQFEPDFVAHPDNDLCKYGKIGDSLWVRESGQISLEKDAFMYFDAGGKLSPSAPQGSENWAREWKSCPSIHMPRWASRITLEITGVRVERLNDIGYQDVLCEGIESEKPDGLTDDYKCDTTDKFVELWESINGEGSWQKNPWVWVIEFKKI